MIVAMVCKWYRRARQLGTVVLGTFSQSCANQKYLVRFALASCTKSLRGSHSTAAFRATVRADGRTPQRHGCWTEQNERSPVGNNRKSLNVSLGSAGWYFRQFLNTAHKSFAVQFIDDLMDASRQRRRFEMRLGKGGEHDNRSGGHNSFQHPACINAIHEWHCEIYHN
jgi:DNA-dependent RNA polymerase auxiliary subunit epsilon